MTYDQLKQVLKQEFSSNSLQFDDVQKMAAIAFSIENEIDESDFIMPYSLNIAIYQEKNILKIYTDVFHPESVATTDFLTRYPTMLGHVDLIRFLYEPSIKNIYISSEIYFKNAQISSEQLLFYIYNIQNFLMRFQRELKPFFRK